MRSRSILALALVLLFVIATPVMAEPLQQNQVQITSPSINEEIRGLVAIVGSASIDNFQYYKIEYGVGPNPTDWAIIGAMHETAILNNQLATWNTEALPDGIYSLRLRAVKADGNYEEFYVRGVVIANTRPTSTPTPTEAPTATPTLAGSSSITGQPTATLVLATPTADLSLPTPTPTLSRPDTETTILPIDPSGWSDAFILGAIAMAAVFVVAGIVFAIRRLL